MQPIFHLVPSAPNPIAPFSHAVESGGFLFLTGQMPSDAGQGGRYPDGIEAQTRQVMRNLMQVLEGCGASLKDVVSSRVYLTYFVEDYDPMNAAYAGFFDADTLPARTCVGVTHLARGARIEIDMVARKPA